MNPPSRLILVWLGAAALMAGGPLHAGQAAGKPADASRAYVHKLALGDTVRVAVYGEEELTQTVRIDARGLVNLPLVEQIGLGGLTIEQAKAKIEAAYREGRFLRNPQVTITVESYTPREITVQGRVRSPQRLALPLESTYTISQAITKCGGLDDIAKGSEVTIRRPMADGTYKVFVVNVDRLLKGKSGAKVEDDFLLEPDDIVYVPERLI
jgi:polysaccharide export outer membrane protein